MTFAGIGLVIFVIVVALIISCSYGVLSYVLAKNIWIPNCLFAVAFTIIIVSLTSKILNARKKAQIDEARQDNFN